MTPLRIGLVAAFAAALLAAAYLFWPRREPPPLPPPPVIAPKAPPAAPKFPLSAPAEPQLPPLAESDASMVAALEALLGASTVQKLILPEALVRRIVATVDNLPRETYASRLNPVRPPGGLFLTTGKDATLAIAPKNAERYRPAVSVFTALDPKKAVDVYVRFYPLFQAAYVELGYPDAYFNDRLVQVIDHLLEAPELDAPPKLVVPHVLYEFADAELESRSSGHKLLMRMGKENALKVKAMLRLLRAEIAARSAPPSAPARP